MPISDRPKCRTGSASPQRPSDGWGADIEAHHEQDRGRARRQTGEGGTGEVVVLMVLSGANAGLGC